MLKEYDIYSNQKNSLISLELPDSIIKELVMFSNDNGTSIQLEIAMRLARSLERDYLRVKYDEKLAYSAFEYIYGQNEN